MHTVASSRTATRPGAILAELIVALLLASIAAAIGGGILVAAERRTRRDATADRAGQTVRDLTRLLSSEIGAALPESVTVRGDTALDLHAHVGVSVLCARSAGAVVLPGTSTSAGVPFSFWRQPPEAADLLVVWDTSGGGRWQSIVVDSAVLAPDGAGCGTTSGFRTAADSQSRVATMRIFSSQAIPMGVPPGAPVRVYRPVRWTLYRGSDQSWSLGYRRCPRGQCGTVQPVAGPLAASSDSGLWFSARSRGTVVVMMRAAAPPASAAQKTVMVTIAVRGALHAWP